MTLSAALAACDRPLAPTDGGTDNADATVVLGADAAADGARDTGFIGIDAAISIDATISFDAASTCRDRVGVESDDKLPAGTVALAPKRRPR